MKTSEAVDSAVSYGIGGGLIYLSHVADYVELATLILGCLIGGIRLIYEMIRLYRYIGKKNESD